MAFTKYEDSASTRRSSGPSITITTRGLITLSAEAADLINRAQNVTLLFDHDEQVLGLEPAGPNDSGAVPVRVLRDAVGSRMVSRKKAFLDWAGIDYSTARRWPAYVHAGILCADLSKPGEPVTSNRSRVLI